MKEFLKAFLWAVAIILSVQGLWVLLVGIGNFDWEVIALSAIWFSGAIVACPVTYSKYIKKYTSQLIPQALLVLIIIGPIQVFAVMFANTGNTQQFTERSEGQLNSEHESSSAQCFSPWDGSHYKLVRYVKEGLNGSFWHVETQHWVTHDKINVMMTFRGPNEYGGRSFYRVRAVTNENCDILLVHRLP